MLASARKVMWYQSIKAKVVCLTIVVNTLILGGFAVYNAMLTQVQMREELQHLAVVTAARLAKHLVIPLWDLDKEQIEETLRSEMLEKRLYAIVVRDSDGKTVFAGNERGSDWTVQALRPQTLASVPGLVTASKRLEKGLEKIGEVEVYLSPKFLEEELAHSVRTVLGSVLVLDAVMLAAILLALQRMVIKPIGQLAAAADGMSMGNLNVTIDVKSRDEIGNVAAAMERMKVSLQMAMRRLQQGR